MKNSSGILSFYVAKKVGRKNSCACHVEISRELVEKCHCCSSFTTFKPTEIYHRDSHLIFFYRICTFFERFGQCTTDLICHQFLVVGPATQIQKSVEMSTLNELGYTPKYMRCLQMSEVVYSMKGLIDNHLDTGMGPLDAYSKFSNKNLPRLEENIINNEEQLENNNAYISDVDIPIGNLSATAYVITDNEPQQNPLGPDNGSLAQNPLWLNDMLSQGSNSSPKNGTDDSKATKNGVIVNENPAMGTGYELNEAVAPKDDGNLDLDLDLDDFDGNFMSENDWENMIDDFDWSI